MSQIIKRLPESALRSPLPTPREPIAIRVAVMEDFVAIDAIQKAHHKQLGFFPRAQMAGYINGGWVIVAEDRHTGAIGGYCASRDRYLKRDELGAIFQLCVKPGSQRKFVGMALLKHVFENAPYGCKLYCCLCAQDIEANRFWEAMGFVALAFRTGSRGKGTGGSARAHIFWQKRIREGDAETPYWFPSQTGGGAIREDRLVLPIPPGVRWSDAMPVVLPGTEMAGAGDEEPKRLLAPRKKREKKVVLPPSAIVGGGLRFGPIAGIAGIAREQTAIEKPTREKIKASKNDPKLIAAARELRDRWLEQMNAGEYQIEGNGKYEVCRLPEPCAYRRASLLPAA